MPMYRGGKICLTVHFKLLWAKNCPGFGIAHALCLGLAPWLAAEVPVLVDSGMIKHKDDATSSSETLVVLCKNVEAVDLNIEFKSSYSFYSFLVQ
ncbi:hypothetical protein I3843_03G019900 [Carya illinoinensis]|nr:hypothetical protein I3843_03G019900 [Carya illinoinensis]